MYCEKCGHKVKENDFFCTKCGYRLKRKNQKEEIEKLKKQEQKKYEKEKIRQTKTEQKKLKKETCSICGEKLMSCYKLKDKNYICKNCIKKLGGFWKSNWVNMVKEEAIEIINENEIMNCPICKKSVNQTNNAHMDGIMNINIDHNIKLTEKDYKKIEEREKQTQLLKKNYKKYKKYIEESFKISEEIWKKKLYSKAINQININNKYANRYIELCNRLLKLLPYEIEYDKEEAKIRQQEYQVCGIGNHLINFIRLLEKQKKYNEILDVCNYLLSLGFTEDGTKKGIKGRIEKAVNNLNAKNNTNYKYYSDNNLIVDMETGEIVQEH